MASTSFLAVLWLVPAVAAFQAPCAPARHARRCAAPVSGFFDFLDPRERGWGGEGHLGRRTSDRDWQGPGGSPGGLPGGEAWRQGQDGRPGSFGERGMGGPRGGDYRDDYRQSSGSAWVATPDQEAFRESRYRKEDDRRREAARRQAWQTGITDHPRADQYGRDANRYNDRRYNDQRYYGSYDDRDRYDRYDERGPSAFPMFDRILGRGEYDDRRGGRGWGGGGRRDGYRSWPGGREGGRRLGSSGGFFGRGSGVNDPLSSQYGESWGSRRNRWSDNGTPW